MNQALQVVARLPSCPKCRGEAQTYRFRGATFCACVHCGLLCASTVFKRSQFQAFKEFLTKAPHLWWSWRVYLN